FLFHLLTLLPPSPTLFPYTTLFRSRTFEHLKGSDDRCDLARRHITVAIVQVHSLEPSGVVRPPSLGGSRSSPAGIACIMWRTHGDRKSTRLNSSHVAISYAVFCLKK